MQIKITKEQLRQIITEEYEKVLFEEQFRHLMESDKVFKGIMAFLTGLSLMVGMEVADLNSQEAAATAEHAQQQVEHKDSNADRLKSFGKTVYPGTGFVWNDVTQEHPFTGEISLDPRAPGHMPLLRRGDYVYYVFPPDWSIAQQVFLDKGEPALDGAPYISVPGSSVGTFPSAKEIESVFRKSRSKAIADDMAINFIDDYREDLIEMSSGSSFGALYLPAELIPDNEPLVVTGLTKRELYIYYYFGEGLGKEDAKWFLSHMPELEQMDSELPAQRLKRIKK